MEARIKTKKNKIEAPHTIVCGNVMLIKVVKTSVSQFLNLFLPQT